MLGQSADFFERFPRICFANRMTSYLNERRVRIFDYPRFAEPYQNEVRENAERLAAEADLEIEFIRIRDSVQGSEWLL